MVETVKANNHRTQLFLAAGLAGAIDSTPGWPNNDISCRGLDTTAATTRRQNRLVGTNMHTATTKMLRSNIGALSDDCWNDFHVSLSHAYAASPIYACTCTPTSAQNWCDVKRHISINFCTRDFTLRPGDVPRTTLTD